MAKLYPNVPWMILAIYWTPGGLPTCPFKAGAGYLSLSPTLQLATVYTRLLGLHSRYALPSSIGPECLPKMHVEHLRVSRGSRKL